MADILSCRWNEWLTVPIDCSTLPLSSQLAITIWDLSPSGGEGAKGRHIPFGGTTVPLFDNDCTLRQGRQKCLVHRHRAADGLSNTSTPAISPRRRHSGERNGANAEEEDEVERLEKLLKKHEMGEIPRIDWLDQLTFRAIEQRGLPMPSGKNVSTGRPVPDGGLNTKGDRTPEAQEGDRDNNRQAQQPNGHSKEREEEAHFILFIDFPRFDFPIVFTDHEYPSPSVAAMSSTVTLKPPPRIYPAVDADSSTDGPLGSRIIRIYDPEVFARDNPAESMHRRLVRSHRTSMLDRDLKPNAKIRDELNVGSRFLSLFFLIRASLTWV